LNWAGHSAVLHGCTVEDEAFVGMGATLLDGVVVEKHAMVAAGALVRQNTRIPTGEVCWLTLSLSLRLQRYFFSGFFNWWLFICNKMHQGYFHLYL
jgi:hypothetical protein